MFSQCCICLCKNRTLHKIQETDDDKVSWQQKLKSFIVEEFPETFKLCKLCCDEVKRATNFQKQCLQALERAKQEHFSCIHCNKTYKQKATLLKHINRLHTKMQTKLFSSNLDLINKCLETCIDITDGEINPSSITKPSKIEAEYTCYICLSILKSKYRLKRHLENVHATEKRYTCTLCNQRFVNHMYLKAHSKYHSDERPYVCTKCGKRFFSSSDLNHHEKIHANVRAYRCDICSKSFNTASDRLKHQMCVHADQATWRFACSVCGRKFPLSGNRDAHERTHTSYKPHCCHLCDRAFSTAFSLKRHIATHSQEKRFKCTEPQCDVEYKNARSLTIHKLKQHSEQAGNVSNKLCAGARRKITYNCQICTKSFPSKVKLAKHLCGHTGEKPFGCNVCEKTFIDKSYVKQHIKIEHDYMS